ncbi:Tn3 family transposase [Nonomuraea terrae]|uniref:Tn3 family transposase n=1 Tax=Nonomuraea terrae TaxID=2530383 RepID=UPI0037ABE922
MVFGIFSMLGHRFAPRFADLGDQRFWRPDLPDGTTGDYGGRWRHAVPGKS